MQPSSVKAVLAQGVLKLKDSDIATAPLDVALLLAHILGLPREQLLVNQDKLLTNKEISDFFLLVARRQQYEPIAYITGKKEFWSLDFYVTRDTLIPRPDSETLIAAALERVKDRAGPATILDIGTGTGCLLVTLLKELPNARGVGVDNSEAALRVARENAKQHNVESRAEFIRSHWCDALDRTFDLILSNPPYIAESAFATLMPDVARYEPKAALLAGPDGLAAYRALASGVAKLLAREGVVCLEVGEGQAQQVEKILQAQGLKTEMAKKDLSGIARCVIARREAASK